MASEQRVGNRAKGVGACFSSEVGNQSKAPFFYVLPPVSLLGATRVESLILANVLLKPVMQLYSVGRGILRERTLEA